MISNVTGGFDKLSGQIIYSPSDFNKSQANVVIDVMSINTRVPGRDAHLKSPDFFDAAQFPAISFISTQFIPGAIMGKLTMKGKTRLITVPVTISGPIKGMRGEEVIGITGAVTLNRQDWGINWNKTLDKGGLAVGNEVLVNISIEADKSQVRK
ncbi:MAG: YceI family protein, partial [Candidatus Omnitrophica bacterium]|nr:YceI family protein [Candidatus Omnitrophota bacterium]